MVSMSSLKGLFTTLVRSGLWARIWPTIRDFTSKEGRAALDAAVGIVADAAAQEDLAPPERFAYAREKMLAWAKAEGVTIGESLIARAIEIALRSTRATSHEIGEATPSDDTHDAPAPTATPLTPVEPKPAAPQLRASKKVDAPKKADPAGGEGASS